MLRIQMYNFLNTLSLKLEGRFTGNDADNARALLMRYRQGIKLVVVDLNEVTFIDLVGEEVLSFFGRFGAEFAASTSYTLDVCERLHLRLTAETGLDTEMSRTSRRNRRRAHPPQSGKSRLKTPAK
jgi:hypothetical protein